MMKKIWERYFLREFLKIFALIIFCFYGIYMLIDYASHSSSHHHYHTQFHWKELAQYYTNEFIQRADVLLPFALLLASIRTLTHFNLSNELVALMVSGIKLKTLFRPFLLFGLLSTFFIYLNTEYALPEALKDRRHLHDSHRLQKNKKNKKLFVQNVALKDETTLLFQEYDSSKGLFFDSYWIKSFAEIYRIRNLNPNGTVPIGTFVELFVRDDDGNLIKKGSWKEKSFPEMQFNQKALLDTIIPAEELSISELWNKLPKRTGILNERESQIATTFYQKMAIPWLCLVAIVAPAPFCVRFSRQFPLFLIYALGLFGLVACYLFLDAAAVLGSRQVLPAYWAVGVPFSIIIGFAIWQYLRLK